MSEEIIKTAIGGVVALKVLEAGSNMITGKKGKVKKVKKLKPFKKIKY